MIYVFDQDDNLLTSLNNDSDETCPYESPYLDDLLNETPEFEFTVPTSHPDSKYIKGENQVAVQDIDGIWRLFVIKELNETLDEITAICISGMNELIETFIEDKRPQDVTAKSALTSGLERSRYEPGTVAELGLNSTNFYRISAAKAVEKIINTWGGEVRDRVEFDESGITGRFIDILERRGADTGHRFEVGVDIESIEVTIQSYPITALYGYGKSLETENGGYTRRIDFADVEWSTNNGNPVDKPLGQTWVGDPDALEKWGRIKDGQRIHREGKFEDSEEENPSRLLEKTWTNLQGSTEPNINIKMNVITLENISGYEHKKVRLGDTTHAFIEELDIVTEQRVIRHRYNIDDFSDAEVELGDPILTDNESERLERVESKLTEKEGVWDQGLVSTVTDDSFPNNVPPVPSNFRANGSFKIIQVLWDYDPSSYIAAYEVYASQVQGFTPDSSNLVWRGKSGGYNHNADTDQQWYFRIRAINTHGTPSDYSVEISAQTLQINADTDVQPLSITNQLIAENAAIDFAKIANVEITSAMIVNLVADKIKGGNFSGETFTGGRFEGAEFYTGDSTHYTEISGGSIDNYSDQDFGTGHVHIGSGGININVVEDSSKWGMLNAFDGLVLRNALAISARNTPVKVTTTGLTELITLGTDGRVYARNEIQTDFSSFQIRSIDVSSSGGWARGFEVYRPQAGGGDSRIVQFGVLGSGTDFTRAYIGHAGINNAPHNDTWIRFTGTNGLIGQVEVSTVLDVQDYLYANGATIRGSLSVHNNITGDGYFSVSATGSGVLDLISDNNVRARTSSGGWQDLHAASIEVHSGYVVTNAVDHNGNGAHMYIRPASNGEVRATAVGTTTTYRPVRASSFPTSSLAEMKQDIEEYQGSALDVIMNTTLYQYRLIDDVVNDIDKLRVGAVIGENYHVSEEIIDEHGEGVEQYLMNSYSWKAIQELYLITQDQSADIKDLTERVEALESKVA